MSKPQTPSTPATTAPAPSAARTVHLTLGIITLLGIAALGGAWWYGMTEAQRNHDALVTELAAQRTEIEDLESAIQYLRIEQKSEAKGVYGVIEQIVLWADVLCDSKASEVASSSARTSMDDALRAMEHLGIDAFPAIYNAIVDAPDHLESVGACVDERRIWLLRGAARADPQRALELAARFLRGHDSELRTTPRMRWLAADTLIDLDRQVAAIELRGILQNESARGLDPNLVVGALPQSRSTQGFHNFVPRYLRAQDPEQETTLLQVLGKAQHDMVTKQECIKALGDSKSQEAVSFIERLFDNTPEMANNAIFKNHCIHALVKIRGRDACPWLEDHFTNETNDIVIATLKDQIVKLGCK